MSEEEIKAEAVRLGLDPALLVIYESWFDRRFGARRFRIDYKGERPCSMEFLVHRFHNWNPELLDMLIRERVTRGLMKIMDGEVGEF